MSAQGNEAAKNRGKNNYKSKQNKHGYALDKHMMHMIPAFGRTKAPVNGCF